MLHVLLIVACVGLHLAADPTWRPPINLDRAPDGSTGGLWSIAAWLLPPLVGLALLQLGARRAIRAMDTHGHARLAALAERRAAGLRGLTCLWFAASSLSLGPLAPISNGLAGFGLAAGLAWAGAELLAIVALSLFLAGSYWVFSPVETRLRQATLLRDLDAGQPVWAIPSRGAYTLAQMRNHALWILVPVSILLIASRAIESLLLPALGGPTGPEGAPPTGLSLLLDVVGLVLAVALMPLVQARVWETVPLGPGAILDAVSGLASRARVRVRRILVWRTRGLSVNAVVLGALPRLRYLVFTDAMLEALPLTHVRAVAAHEIAHLRRHHIPWLIAGMAGTITLAGEGALRLAERLSVTGPGIEAAATLGALAVTLPLAAWVSRRVEWQADADAARLLARADAPENPAGVLPHSAMTVSMALGSVAALNHIDPDRFTHRHGSITHRRGRLHALARDPRAADANDSVVGTVKAITLAAWGVIGVLAMM